MWTLRKKLFLYLWNARVVLLMQVLEYLHAFLFSPCLSLVSADIGDTDSTHIIAHKLAVTDTERCTKTGIECTGNGMLIIFNCTSINNECKRKN